MKAVKQVAPHPMVAKVAHLPKIQQVKAVKAQVKTAHPHKDKVDKAMAILKAVKVKEIPIVVRVKVMAEIPKSKVKAVLMAEVKVKAMAILMVAVKKETATIVAVKVAKMLNAHSPKKEIPIVKTEMVAIPTPIPIQIREQPIQIQTKMTKKATKVEILPKRVIPMAEIRAMKAVKVILLHSRPKMKML